jgi:hypothetical protein
MVAVISGSAAYFVPMGQQVAALFAPGVCHLVPLAMILPAKAGRMESGYLHRHVLSHGDGDCSTDVRGSRRNERHYMYRISLLARTETHAHVTQLSPMRSGRRRSTKESRPVQRARPTGFPRHCLGIFKQSSSLKRDAVPKQPGADESVIGTAEPSHGPFSTLPYFEFTALF